MGRLHRLELENFKSYNGKQVIGPFDNFTCIIGPNGAGKSNMMDAISFVLGVQSKHLRSTNLKDLVYRKDADSAPARKASVLLVYSVENDDLEGYAKGSEIHFSRSITGSAGVSSYRLGGKEVTFEVYETLLLKIGVLVKARNFLVFQGDVETVASKSPAELTKLLEQICGSDALTAEYEELQRKRDEAEENTLFSIQKKKMYVTQSKEIKSQKDEADFFQLKQEELSEAKTEHTLWQIWRIKSEMEDHQAAGEELKGQLEAIKDKEGEIDAELQEGKKELAKVSKEVAGEEKDLQSRQKQLDAILPKLSDARAKLKSLQKRAAEQKKREEKESADLAEQAENLENLRGEIASTSKLDAKLQAELNSSGSSSSSGSEVSKLGAGDWSEYSRLRELVSSRSAVDRTNELALDLELKGKQHQVTQLEGQQQALQEELASSAKLIQNYVERSSKLHEAVKANEQAHKDLSAEKQRKTRESETAAETLKELHVEQEQLNIKLRNAGDDKRRNKQEDRISEAIKTMQLMHKGVHGKLVDFCRPIQKKYAQAIMVAAGKSMDAIVVDTTHTAAECMKYLKEQKVGVCQFLPLDNISTAPIADKLRTFGSRYRPCFDVVECDETYRTAVLYAVGSTVVCDTLEDAQDLCFRRNERVKAVTLGGQIISKSGAMTGGIAAGDVRQDRWAEKDLEVLRGQYATVSSRISEVEHSANARQYLVECDMKIKALDAQIKFNHADIKITDEKLSQLKQQKGLHEKKLEGLTKDLNAVKADIGKLETQLSKLQQNTREIENEIFKDFSARVGVTNIRDYEEQTLRRQQKVVQQHAAVSKKLASLTSQLEFEQSRKCQQTLENTRSEIRQTKEEASNVELQEQATLDKELKVRAGIREVNGTLQRLKTQSQNISHSMNSVQGRRTDLQSTKEGLAKKLAGEEHVIERSRVHLHEVLQKAQVDEVALPTVEENDVDMELSWTGNQSQNQLFSSGGGNKRGAKRGAAGLDESSESDTTVGGGGTSSSSSSAAQGSRHFSQAGDATVLRDGKKMAKVDLSSMRVHKNLSKQRMNEKDGELVKKISDLMEELETIQPNMHAAERYAGVLDKLKECNDELDNTKELARDVTTRFDEVKRTRLNLFQECYDHVSRSLGQIYKDLTKSSKHPMGGNAYLTLDNTDEPYLGGIRFTAMPPMKRFRDMEQLSGGEKTMAALALLFSIHSFRRAPFFVLDEVDAALDNVNVKKLCNYIRQTSDSFQCVVISLKDMFFEHADSLVGVCKDVESLSSQVLTLDLKAYDHNTGAGTGSQVPPSPISSVGGVNSKTSTPSKGSVVSAGEYRHPHLQQQQLGKRRGPGDAAAGGRQRAAPQPLYKESIEEGDEDQEE